MDEHIVVLHGFIKKSQLTPADDLALARRRKREDFQAVAIKEVLAWQIEQAMKAKNLSRSALATRMKTSRNQIGRLLDPKDGNVTLATLQRAAVSWDGHSGWSSFKRRAWFARRSDAANLTMRVENDPDVSGIIHIIMEIKELPIGDQKKFWPAQAVIDLQPDIDRVLQWANESGFACCRNLLARSESLLQCP
jgi:antitoxin HicB